MTLFEALTGGAFDRLNWQHSGEFDQNFSKKSNALEFAQVGGMGSFGIDWYIRKKHCQRMERAGCKKMFTCMPPRSAILLV